VKVVLPLFAEHKTSTDTNSLLTLGDITGAPFGRIIRQVTRAKGNHWNFGFIGSAPEREDSLHYNGKKAEKDMPAASKTSEITAKEESTEYPAKSTNKD